MFCPKCGSKYECASQTCKGKGWKMYDEDIKCLKCGLKMSMDWWFELETDIYRKELKSPQI